LPGDKSCLWKSAAGAWYVSAALKKEKPMFRPLLLLTVATFIGSSLFANAATPAINLTGEEAVAMYKDIYQKMKEEKVAFSHTAFGVEPSWVTAKVQLGTLTIECRITSVPKEIGVYVAKGSSCLVLAD
jgi:hypothetical protein